MKNFLVDLKIACTSDSRTDLGNQGTVNYDLQSDYSKITIKISDNVQPFSLIQKYLTLFNATIQSLDIDISKQEKIFVTFRLTGEASAISVSATVLKLSNSENSRLKIIDLKATKPWIEVLLNEIILEEYFETDRRTISIPSFLINILP